MPGGAARFGDISGLDLLSPTQRAKALGMAQRPLGPGRNGWVTARDVYRAILQQEPYPVRMLVSFGTNLLASQPDTVQARAALAALEFHVHADFFLNPSAQYADIVLPVATSWEREGLRPGFDVSLAGMRKVQLRPAVIAPVGLARSDADIALALAERLGMKAQFFDGSIDAGHDEMLAPAGLNTQALRAQPEGITLPNAVPLQAYASVDATGAPTGFPTPSRKMEIYSEQLHRIGQQAVPFLRENDLPQTEASYPLQLSGAKTMVYCHSQHRNLPSLRRLQPDPILEISEQAARHRSIADRDWVRVRSKAGQFLARARISAAQSPEAVFAQHGWWVSSAADGSSPGVAQEDPGKLAAAESKQPDKRDFPVNMNAAIDTSCADPVSGSVPLRSAWCEVERIEADPNGAGLS